MLLLLLAPLAMAHESEPVEFELDDLAPLYEDAEYSTGWLPADSPIAVQFAIEADGGAYVYQEGEANLSWPDALTFAIEGYPGTGEIFIDTTMSAVTSIKFDIDVYSYEAEIDRQSLSIGGEGEFDPWLLPGSGMDEVEVVFEDSGIELVDYTFTPFTGVDVVFIVDLTPTSTTVMEGVAWNIEDGWIEWEGDTLDIEPTGNPMEKLLGTYYASFESNYALVLQPSAEVCVPVVGCIELIAFDIPFTLAEDSFEHEFPPVPMDFPVPLLATDIEVYDFGEVEVGNLANLEIAVANVGAMDLEGTASVDGPEDFSTFPEYFKAGPDTSDGLVVSFAPSGEGQFEATLVLTSNDPYTPAKEILLTGTGFVVGSEDGSGETESPKTQTVSTEIRGCNCATAEAPASAAWMVALLAGLGLMRRREDRPERG